MERQSSFGSQGSGRSSATKIVDDAQKHGEKGDNLNSNNGFVVALFGALFTLAKEKISDSWKVAVLTVVVDFLLILAIMLNLEYPWAVNPNNVLWKIFYMIEIHKPLSAAGYKFYLVTFYLLSAMLYLCIAICVWVAWCFKNDSFPFLWPIKFVRVVASLFFGMFYIAALNIFLVILECAPYHGTWEQHIWHVQCFAMPHLVHLIVATVSSVTFAVAALLLVTADHELEPMSKSLLGAPHSMCELKAQLAKTVITVVDVLLWDFPRVQGVVFMVCCVSTFYFHMKQLPYYTSWMNSFRLCFFAVHAWVAIHLCVLVFAVDATLVKKGKLGYMVWDIHNYSVAKAITDSMSYPLPLIFFGAGIAGMMRLYYFFRVALKFQRLQQQPNLYSKRVHRFADEKDVEIVARVARVWDEDGNVDQQCLDLAEVVIRAGIQQFPKSPYLHIVYANLLIECRQQLQSGWAQMEEARRMPLNLSYRFSIFTREQEHKQKAAVSSSGESAADLVSYVEFQRNYRLIQSYHKAALVAMREFWRLLLHDAVNLNSLTSAFRKIDKMERLADKTYKVVLERYPKAVKLLRSYANFLEMVKNDPWTAAQYNSEADKQEEALENAEQDMGGEDGLSMRNSAIITINGMGIIQMANKHAIKMLGYAKGELDGKNVSCIMPQPFSARHNGYLRNYVTTGKAKILDSMREVVGLHRDRYVFPIKLMVTKTQGNGADATFMGLLKEVEADATTIKAWLMTNGVTLCADQSFTDYAGWAPNDLIGKPFTAITADPEAVAGLLERAAHLTEHELAAGAVQAEVMLMHKYAEEVPVSLRVEMGGTEDQRLLVLVMTRRGEVVPTLVLDHHGRVLFANQALCSLLGTKPKDMRGRDIATLLPQPFGFLHHRWIKDAETSVGKPPPSSCRAGAIHSLVSSNGVHVPVKLQISSREIGGVHMNIVRATRVTAEETLDEQRLNITTDQHGHIISIYSMPHHGAVAPPPPADDGTMPPKPAVFGFAPEHLMGRKLYEAIDIFAEWHSAGHSVMHAVKALAQQTASKPGSAWRVGVMPHHMSLEKERAAAKLERSAMADAAAVANDGATDDASRGQNRQLSHHRQLSHQRRDLKHSTTLLRASMSKSRAAIMQIMGPEHTPDGTHYTIRLWRPELLSGVMELNDRMTVIKADAAAGLIFGIPASTMSQQPLSRFLKLGPPGAMSMRSGKPGGALSVRSGVPGAARVSIGGHNPNELISMESLLGNKHVKGGMKDKAGVHKSGPRRVFEARHADGMPLQISFQVALKNGTSTTRMMAVLRPLNLIKGNIAVLHAVLRGDADIDQCTVENDANSPSLHHIRIANAERLRAAKETATRDAEAKEAAAKEAAGKGGKEGKGGVPKLALAGMASARTLNGGGPGGSGATRSDGVVTTRHVELNGLGSNRTSGTNDPLATHRTDASALATARDVGLDFGATPRPEEPNGSGPGSGDGASPSGSGRQPAEKQLSSVGSGSRNISDDSAMVRSHPGKLGEKDKDKDRDKDKDGAKGGDKEPLSKRFLTRDWDHVVHVDPEQVPVPHDAEYDIEHHVGDDKDMGLSSGSSSHDSDGSGSAAASEDEGQGTKKQGRNTGAAADMMTRDEALQRKRTMAALEPGERVGYVHGVRRVKEWLASGYHFDRRDAQSADSERPASQPVGHSHHSQSHAPSQPAPVRKISSLKKRQLSKVLEETPIGDNTVEDPYDDGLDPDDQLMTLEELAAEVERQETLEEGAEEGEGQEEGEGDQIKDAWAEVGAGGPSRGATHGGRSEGGRSAGGALGAKGGAAGSAAGDGASTGAANNNMNRGRRLKRLLKLLSGQKVSRGVSRLRLHVLFVIALMLLVHAVCFLMLIIFINKQKAFITEISGAGEAIDRSHLTAMFSRSIEAATRGAGFATADIPVMADRLTEEVDRLEYLHQGMYLGFKGLRKSKSDTLNDLWDLPQWNTTVYKDTKVPSFEDKDLTLWNLGNDYISAAREVAYYASNSKLWLPADAVNASLSNGTASPSSPAALSAAASGVMASNVTLPSNRFWLFVRANVGESLYVGYLRVLNTLLLLAQENIYSLKTILVVLLLVEGCIVCFAAIGYVFYLLWKASRARAALFTVFLVIPHGQVKTLASRHITTNQADSDDDDEDDAGKGDGKGDGKSDAGIDDGASDGASVVSGAAGGNASRRSFGGDARRSVDVPDKSALSAANTPGRKAAITFNEHTETKHQGKSDTVMGRIKRAISGDVSAPIMDTGSNAGGPARRFTTRKRLTHTMSDIKHLAWPFFGWGVLIVGIYLVSYLQFAGVEVSLVDLKMFERSSAQASRTMYYATDLALETDPAVQAGLQVTLREEAAWLDTVYSTTLYGGPTLEDSERDGAHDSNTGSLFAKQVHATMLFESKGCLRSSSSCLMESDPFFQVSRHAIDPMMRRLMREATLLSLDDLADINHTSLRWQYVWRVAAVDLHEGLQELVASYRADALAAFTAQGTLHTIIFAVSWLLWAAYLYFLLRPYLQVSSTETKRVAELLSQLPAELDVEGMVEESWLVVADTELDKSGMSVWDPKGHSVAHLAMKSVASIFSAVHLRRFSIGGEGRMSHDRDRGDAVSVVSMASTWKEMVTKGGRRSSISTAAVGAAKGIDLDQEEEEEERQRGAPNKSRSGLALAPQTSVLGSSLFASVDKVASKGGGKVTPEDSAMRKSESGGTDRRGSMDKRGSMDRRGSMDKDRRGSMDKGKRNKVVPVGMPSGTWKDEADGGALPSGADPRSMTSPGGAKGGSNSRPMSPLLDLPMSLVVPAVADTSAVGGQYIKAGAGDKRAAADDHGRAPSPYHFNKVLPSNRNFTEEWGDEEPWTPHAARTRRNSLAMPMPPAGLGGLPGGGDNAIAEALGSAMMKAAEADAAPLANELDDLVSPRPHASGSLPDSRAGSFAQLSLPQPPQLAAATAATALARERLASGSTTNSRPGSALVPAAASAATAAALASGSLHVVDRRTSLDRSPQQSGGSRLSMDRGSRPISAAGSTTRMTSPHTQATSPIPAIGGVGAVSGVSVVSRRTSLDAAAGRPGSRIGSRPASRMGAAGMGGGLAASAHSISMPPPPAFDRAASGSTPGSRPLSKNVSLSGGGGAEPAVAAVPVAEDLVEPMEAAAGRSVTPLEGAAGGDAMEVDGAGGGASKGPSRAGSQASVRARAPSPLGSSPLGQPPLEQPPP